MHATLISTIGKSYYFMWTTFLFHPYKSFHNIYVLDCIHCIYLLIIYLLDCGNSQDTNKIQFFLFVGFWDVFPKVLQYNASTKLYYYAICTVSDQ